jgi:hypothetical protein
VTVLDPAATGDAELDAALGVVSGRRVARCVDDIAAHRPDLPRLRRMREQGLLHTYPNNGKVWLFVRETTTALETVLAPLHSALRLGHCDEQTRALLALVRATRLHLFWLKGLPAAERDRALRALLPVDWLPNLAAPGLPPLA